MIDCRIDLPIFRMWKKTEGFCFKFCSVGISETRSLLLGIHLVNV